MKKIGILTFSSADNYGSVLQAYALLEAIRRITDQEKYIVEIVPYRNNDQRKMYATYNQVSDVRSLLKNAYIAVKYAHKMNQRRNSFDEFRTKYLNIEQKALFSDWKKSGHYDAIVTGSDQIWNTRIPDFDYVYMLSQTPLETKRISYAASMGGIEYSQTDEEKEMIAKLISKYSGISVREQVAQNMIHRSISTDLDIKIHIDPTFLLDRNEWNQLTTRRFDHEKYIFFYSIDYNDDSVDIAKWYGKQFNLPVYVVFSTQKSYKKCNGIIKWAGTHDPADFPALVRDSEFVLSGSFHGSVFSIIYNKPFYRIKRSINGKSIEDDRIHTLFSLLDVEDREIDKASYKKQADRLLNCDYSNVNMQISEQKKRSISYLKQMILEE